MTDRARPSETSAETDDHPAAKVLGESLNIRFGVDISFSNRATYVFTKLKKIISVSSASVLISRLTVISQWKRQIYESILCHVR